MAKVKVAINGFGRIGRLAYRQIYNMEGIDVVAINDLTSPSTLAHLLKYDSAQGRFNEKVSSTEKSIIVNGDEIRIYAQKKPTEIPWGVHDIDVVLECTGFFSSPDRVLSTYATNSKDTSKTNAFQNVVSLDFSEDYRNILLRIPSLKIPLPNIRHLVSVAYFEKSEDIQFHDDNTTLDNINHIINKARTSYKSQKNRKKDKQVIELQNLENEAYKELEKYKIQLVQKLNYFKAIERKEPNYKEITKQIMRQLKLIKEFERNFESQNSLDLNSKFKHFIDYLYYILKLIFLI